MSRQNVDAQGSDVAKNARVASLDGEAGPAC